MANSSFELQPAADLPEDPSKPVYVEPEIVAPPPAIPRAMWTTVPQSPITMREVVAILLMVALGDLTIYRATGFAGPSLFFLVAPIILAVGYFRTQFSWRTWIVCAMLAALVAKMIWLGSGLLVACGLVLIAAFTMSISGQRPFVAQAIAFWFVSLRAGFEGLCHYGRNLKHFTVPFTKVPWLSVCLPICAFIGFGLIFVLANPNLADSLSKAITNFLDGLDAWLLDFAFGEIVFWMFVAWVTIGFLRPLISTFNSEDEVNSESPAGIDNPEFFPAFRNTLYTLIGLFAVYLVFEFSTLWFREFPKGFYYAGYAHQGAFWLTVALALATLVLSLIFRGSILQNPNVGQLRRLAWIWSALNFILAIAVYNRLFIYINFNGMTWMRMIGLFGISTVVAGFVCVIWKINHDRSFTWLIRRHLLALATSIFLFALTPVDSIVQSYNVRRIMAGDLAPSVQISRHPISAEGYAHLPELLDCRDPIIREGIRAMLAERQLHCQEWVGQYKENGWTTYQIAEWRLVRQLDLNTANWMEYVEDPAARESAINKFRDYAFQWW